MEEKARAAIKKWRMIEAGDRIVVALSGGADSTALFYFLLSSRVAYGIEIIAAHLNHCLRGDESDGDEIFCADICAKHGVSFFSRRADVAEESSKRHTSIEETGRDLRYEFFNDVSINNNANKIAVAHTKNDQAETVLINLLRGSGTRGLGGFAPVNNKIIRPLVYVSRDETEAYCRKHGLAFRTDSSNKKTDHTRNKIRLALLPYIAKNINPSVYDALGSCGELAGEDARYLDKLAADAYAECREDGGALNIDKLARYPDCIARRILRAAYGEARGRLKDFGSAHTEALLGLARGQSGKKIFLPNGGAAVKNYSKIYFSRRNINDEKTKDFNYDLVYNEQVFIAELDLYVTVSADAPPARGRTAAVIIDERAGPLAFRSRLPGDKIYFKSVGGRKKIKELLNEKKIPACRRNRVGMLAQGSDILWIPSLDIKADAYNGGGAAVYVGISGNDDPER